MKRARSGMLYCVALVAIAIGREGAPREALASPAPGPVPPPMSAPAIVRIDGASKPRKPPPPPLDPQLVSPVDDCVQAAYAALESSARSLSAGDPVLLAATYRARKESAVGASALRAAGCRRPGEK